MKKCFKCGEEKELSEFYKDTRNSSGLRSWCKVCCYKNKAEHRREIKSGVFKKTLNPTARNGFKWCNLCEEIKPVGEFGKDAKKKAGIRSACKKCSAERAKFYRLKNIERVHIYQKQWMLLNPKKSVAHNRVETALRNKTMVRPALCFECGAQCKPVAHHCDYDKPLEVVWLCQACHCQWHAKNGEGLNARDVEIAA